MNPRTYSILQNNRRPEKTSSEGELGFCTEEQGDDETDCGKVLLQLEVDAAIAIPGFDPRGVLEDE